MTYWIGFIHGAAIMGWLATFSIAYVRITELLRAERRGEGR